MRLFVCQTCLLLFVAIAQSLPIAVGDGPSDNAAGKVRPIPPLGIEVDEETIESLTKQCREVRQSWSDLITSVRAAKPKQKYLIAAHESRLAHLNSLTPEILVFPRAVEMAIELNQFHKPKETEDAAKLLQQAIKRIEVADRSGSWAEIVGIGDGSKQTLIVGGFASKIDGSFQPYSVVVPAGYSAGDARPRRLDLWFHGRGETLSEVAFLNNQQSNPGQYTPADSFVLHPYGRYSNAFKFAGEIDVLEALDYIETRLPVNGDLIAVRGFSMGGAGCWQMAVHYADRFFAANPGAGFSETPEFLSFFQGEDVAGSTPEYQKTLWQMYDCPRWATNLKQCPTIVYSGEIDRQKQAADVMEVALDEGRHQDAAHHRSRYSAQNSSRIETRGRRANGRSSTHDVK